MSIIHSLFLSIALYFCTTTLALHADEKTDTPIKEDNAAIGTNQDEIEEEDTDTSEIERLVKIKAAIKSDKQALKEVKRSLAGRTKISKKLQRALQKSSDNIENMENQLLQAKEKSDQKKILNLEEKISALKKDHDLIKEQTQLTYEAEKTVKKQIELL